MHEGEFLLLPGQVGKQMNIRVPDSQGSRKAVQSMTSDAPSHWSHTSSLCGVHCEHSPSDTRDSEHKNNESIRKSSLIPMSCKLGAILTGSPPAPAPFPRAAAPTDQSEENDTTTVKLEEDNIFCWQSLLSKRSLNFTKCTERIGQEAFKNEQLPNRSVSRSGNGPAILPATPTPRSSRESRVENPERNRPLDAGPTLPRHHPGSSWHTGLKAFGVFSHIFPCKSRYA
ncbi:hypothetical protein CB1_001278009 [Camelus ferus]|nr:hypothetical protein CB1_001278009 [Camelus ferus]